MQWADCVELDFEGLEILKKMRRWGLLSRLTYSSSYGLKNVDNGSFL